VSGGKDSLMLLWALAERRKRVPVHYDLYPIYVDPGFEGGFGEALADTCQQLGFSLTVDPTDHGIVAHSAANRENPCFLCSRLRRKRLFEIADRLGCAKLALGHNKDDIIETFFLNVCYAGEISTMVPRQSLFNGRFTVIRPLAMVDEKAYTADCRNAAVSPIRQSVSIGRNHQTIGNQGDAGNTLPGQPQDQGQYLPGHEPCEGGVPVEITKNAAVIIRQPGRS
jgi:tRNA(Ile)-lysidine synthase TilS/MesJ